MQAMRPDELRAVRAEHPGASFRQTRLVQQKVREISGERPAIAL